MGDPKRDKNGRYAGSIGKGKNHVPSAAHQAHPALPPAAPESSAASVHLSDLAEKVLSRVHAHSTPPPENLTFLTQAEDAVRKAAQHWEATREWAYPGVGDHEAEKELSHSYQELSLARENLHRARILAAQSEQGREHLRKQIQEWTSRGEAAATSGGNALSCFVQAQEIHDVLIEEERRQAVEEEFQRIISQPSGQAS